MFRKILSLFVIIFVFVFAFCGFAKAAVTAEEPHWNKSPINVYIPQDEKQSSMRQAFERWQNQSYGKLKFTFVDKGPADIDVVFTETVDGTDTPIASYNITVKGNEITKAEIMIATKNKNIQKYSNNYIFTTMLHEIGHVLGLSHNNRKKTCIMYTPIEENQELTKVEMMKLYHLNGWNWAQKNISK